MDFQQRKALKHRTSFCFCRRASRFVQKAQEQSRRIKRRLGSSSSIGRDMAGLVESALLPGVERGPSLELTVGGGRGAPQKSLTVGYTSLQCSFSSLLTLCSPCAGLGMKFSMVPTAAVALGLSCGVESFVAPFPGGQQHRCTSALSAHMIRTSGARSSSSNRLMMGGFGEPVKKKKPVGVGRGQEAYQRQMKSYNGLIGAGAEGTDIYVHREVS